MEIPHENWKSITVNIYCNIHQTILGLQVKNVNQEGKEFCVLDELGNKMQLGSEGTVSPSLGSVEDQVAKLWKIYKI